MTRKWLIRLCDAARFRILCIIQRHPASWWSRRKDRLWFCLAVRRLLIKIGHHLRGYKNYTFEYDEGAKPEMLRKLGEAVAPPCMKPFALLATNFSWGLNMRNRGRYIIGPNTIILNCPNCGGHLDYRVSFDWRRWECISCGWTAKETWPSRLQQPTAPSPSTCSTGSLPRYCVPGLPERPADGLPQPPTDSQTSA